MFYFSRSSFLCLVLQSEAAITVYLDLWQYTCARKFHTSRKKLVKLKNRKNYRFLVLISLICQWQKYLYVERWPIILLSLRNTFLATSQTGCRFLNLLVWRLFCSVKCIFQQWCVEIVYSAEGGASERRKSNRIMRFQGNVGVVPMFSDVHSWLSQLEINSFQLGRHT